MKLFFAILIFIFGFFLTLLGLLFKLESWANATEMLILGLLLGLSGLALTVVTAMKKRSGRP